jgi:hypothetical protein
LTLGLCSRASIVSCTLHTWLAWLEVEQESLRAQVHGHPRRERKCGRSSLPEGDIPDRSVSVKSSSNSVKPGKAASEYACRSHAGHSTAPGLWQNQLACESGQTSDQFSVSFRPPSLTTETYLQTSDLRIIPGVNDFNATTFEICNIPCCHLPRRTPQIAGE